MPSLTFVRQRAPLSVDMLLLFTNKELPETITPLGTNLIIFNLPIGLVVCLEKGTKRKCGAGDGCMSKAVIAPAAGSQPQAVAHLCKDGIEKPPGDSSPALPPYTHATGEAKGTEPQALGLHLPHAWC